MQQNHPRRHFLFWTLAAPLAFSASATAASQQGGPAPVRPPGQQHGAGQGYGGGPASAGANGTHDGGSINASTGGPAAPDPDPKEVLKANDKDMKSNVSRLADLAEELKKEVEATDSSSVLSLGMVHKAEEIEKLAHHIALLARG
jgi:hypothetical protein